MTPSQWKEQAHRLQREHAVYGYLGNSRVADIAAQAVSQTHRQHLTAADWRKAARKRASEIRRARRMGAFPWAIVLSALVNLLIQWYLNKQREGQS